MEFIVGNYAIFLVIAIVLLLGLFGYMMDRKRYEKYRQEIINEERVVDALEAAPNVGEVNMDGMIPQTAPGVMATGAVEPAAMDPMAGANPQVQVMNTMPQGNTGGQNNQ